MKNVPLVYLFAHNHHINSMHMKYLSQDIRVKYSNIKKYINTSSAIMKKQREYLKYN